MCVSCSKRSSIGEASVCENSTYDFGMQPVDLPAEATLTITNTGDRKMTDVTAPALLTPFAFKGGSYPGTGGTCEMELTPSASCTVVVTFTPTAFTSYSQNFSVRYASGTSEFSKVCTLAGSGRRAYGVLDTSFHTDGLFTTTLLNGGNSANGTSVQTDGKTVVVGSASTGGGDDHFAIIRLQTDGSLDTSFHTDGKQTTADGYANGVLQQSDGKLLVGGTTYGGDLHLVRFRSNGVLDTAFHTDGRAIATYSSGEDLGQYMALQTNGRVVLAGTSTVFAQTMFGTSRFLTNGALDTSFHTDGKRAHAIGSFADEITGMTIQSDSKIVFSGTSVTTIDGDLVTALVRYNTDGNLDTAFHVDGIASMTFSDGDIPTKVAIQVDGMIIVGGVTDTFRYTVARFSTNGYLDTNFHTDGKVSDILTTEAAVQAHDVRVQSDGKVLLGVGFPIAPIFRFGVIRWNTDGTLDSSFGTNGATHTTLGAGDNIYGSIYVTPDKILRVGRHVSGLESIFGVARFWQ